MLSEDCQADFEHVPNWTGDSTNNEPWLAHSRKRCSVIGCRHPAAFEVIACAFDPENDRDVVAEPDYSCPYLCFAHMLENENNGFSVIPADQPGPVLERAFDINCANADRMKVAPIRSPGIGVRYPFTLKDAPAQHAAFVIYNPLERV
jgi:hypothetical protein